MLAVGIWLLTLGLCDLLRAARDTTTARRRVALAVVGLAVLAFFGVATGLNAREWVGIGLAWGLGLLVWLLASAVALEHGTAGRTAPRVLALAALGVGFAVLAVGGGVVGSLGPLPSSMGGSLVASLRLSPDQLVLLAGVAVFELSSANIVVRLVLDAVGVPAVTNEKRLKGGRLLGPMERLFIVGLGLAGALTAAAVVVAAKGLLRFPELRRGSDMAGPTDVTEYFLIGSFTSWLVALAGLALLLLR